MALIKEIYQLARASTQHPAYYYANIPTYPSGGIGLMYVSDLPWPNGSTSGMSNNAMFQRAELRGANGCREVIDYSSSVASRT